MLQLISYRLPTLYNTVIEDELCDYDGCNKTVSGLSPGTQYYFWVEAIDEVGNSSGIQSLGSITTASPAASLDYTRQIVSSSIWTASISPYRVLTYAPSGGTAYVSYHFSTSEILGGPAATVYKVRLDGGGVWSVISDDSSTSGNPGGDGNWQYTDQYNAGSPRGAVDAVHGAGYYFADDLFYLGFVDPNKPASRVLTFRVREIHTTNLIDFTQFKLDGLVMDPATVQFESWLNDPNGEGWSTSRLFDGSDATRFYDYVNNRVGQDLFTITVPGTAQTFSITPFRTNRVPGWEIIENGAVILTTNWGNDSDETQYVTRNYDISQQ